MPYHNLVILYFKASFFIFVRAVRFQKPCSWIWDMMQCHIISTFILYVFRDIILIQLHFLYSNTRWFNLWFIKECHHSLNNEHFPCFLRKVRERMCDRKDAQIFEEKIKRRNILKFIILSLILTFFCDYQLNLIKSETYIQACKSH
jgi:hypothetical protein